MKWEDFKAEERFTLEAGGKKYDTEEQCEELISQLKNKTNIKALRFSGNTFSVEACKYIAKSVVDELHDLVFVDFSDMFTTRLKTDVPPALAAFADAFENHSIVSFDGSHNALGAPGTAAVIKLVKKESFKQLLLDNCGIGTAGALVLTNTFRKLKGKELLSVDEVKENDLKEILKDDDNSAVFTVNFEEIQEIKIEVLRVGRNRFKVDGAEALSFGIGYLVNLKEIHLNANSIKPEGLIAIFQSLKSCANLEVLNVNDNTLKPEGVKHLVELLQNTPNLRQLNVGDCLIEAEGALELLEGIKDILPKLEALNVSYNDLDDEGTEVLIDGLANKPNLTSLDLNGSAISKKLVNKLKDALKSLGRADALGSMSDNEDGEDSEEGSDADD